MAKYAATMVVVRLKPVSPKPYVSFVRRESRSSMEEALISIRIVL
jgi:hypothetical protein